MTAATLDAASDAVVTFRQTADGLLAARIGDDAFVMAPRRNGGFPGPSRRGHGPTSMAMPAISLTKPTSAFISTGISKIAASA